MSIPSGFLFNVPDVLFRGCMYIPLEHQMVLPGGATAIYTASAENAAFFADLKARDELVVASLVRACDPDDDLLCLHDMGCMALVADHELKHEGLWQTTLAGVGRVALGDPYVADSSPYPRMDVAPVSSTTINEAAVRKTLGDFARHAATLGAEHEQVVEVLHQYAASSEDLSLVIDRLGGLV
ncbi:MAG: hypothetical protein AAGI01_17470, partial [Myxococcota bacterium]